MADLVARAPDRAYCRGPRPRLVPAVFWGQTHAMTEEGFIALSGEEVRVLGSLIEKEIATPDVYPLTLNALVNACNQSSNRDPVMSLDERSVSRALDALREKGLAVLFKGADSRVPKFAHRFGAHDSDLGRPEIAVMCELLLRGPQTVGELRGRAGRLHPFASLEEVQSVLDALAARQAGKLVVKLARQAGQKEQRYAHLLSGEADARGSSAQGDHALHLSEGDRRPEAARSGAEDENGRIAKLESECAALRSEIERIKRELADFRKQFE